MCFSKAAKKHKNLSLHPIKIIQNLFLLRGFYPESWKEKKVVFYAFEYASSFIYFD